MGIARYQVADKFYLPSLIGWVDREDSQDFGVDFVVPII